MFCTIRVFIPYAYGTYHTRYRTRMVQFCILYAYGITIRVWYDHTRMVRPYAYGTYHMRITIQYVQITCHACLSAYSYSFFIYGSIFLACSCMPITIYSFSMQPSYRYSCLITAFFNGVNKTFCVTKHYSMMTITSNNIARKQSFWSDTAF